MDRGKRYGLRKTVIFRSMPDIEEHFSGATTGNTGSFHLAPGGVQAYFSLKDAGITVPINILVSG